MKDNFHPSSLGKRPGPTRGTRPRRARLLAEQFGGDGRQVVQVQGTVELFVGLGEDGRAGGGDGGSPAGLAAARLAAGHSSGMIPVLSAAPGLAARRSVGRVTLLAAAVRLPAGRSPKRVTVIAAAR